MQKRLRLNGSPHPPWEGAILRGKGMSRHAGLHSDMNFVKTAEPIEMPFGLWTRVGRRKHKFNLIRQMAPMCLHGKIWRIRLNRLSATTMRPYVKLL